MDAINQMQDRVLAALRASADELGLEWTEVRSTVAEGAVRVHQPGRFTTLLKIEFEFGLHSCRLLLFRAGSHIAGRCGLAYDDGEAIEQLIGRFRELLGECRGRASPVGRHPSRAAEVAPSLAFAPGDGARPTLSATAA